MSQPKIVKDLDHFSRLSTAVYIHEPPINLTTAFPTESDLILLPAWLDAAPRHIAKYTTGYGHLYPSARILVIKTTLPDVIYRSIASNQQRVTPALEILLALPPNAKVLLHLFSNGGAVTSC